MQNYTEPIFNPFAQNVAIIKSYFKRPLVLIIAILYILASLASVVVAFTTSSGMSQMFSSLFSIPEVVEGMTAEDMQMFELYTNEGYMTISMMSSMIPSLILMGLTVASYFIIYFKSKNENPFATPKAGFTILFILSILELIASIGVALLLLLCVALFGILALAMPQEAGMSSGDSAVMVAVFIVLAVIYIALGAVLLTYAINKLRYINSVRNGLSTVNISYKGAGAYGVFSIIFAVMGIISSLTLMLFGPLMSALTASLGEPMLDSLFAPLGNVFLISGAVSILSSVYMLLDGILALGYKKHIKKITNGFDGFFIPQPAYAAAPAPATSPVAETYAPQENVQSAPVFEAPIVTNDTVAMETPVAKPQALCCPKCGAAVNKSDIFCNTCGTKVK